MATIEREYELKLITGKIITWMGKDGMDAAIRYVDCNRGETVIAVRLSKNERYGVFPVDIRHVVIIE